MPGAGGQAEQPPPLRFPPPPLVLGSLATQEAGHTECIGQIRPAEPDRLNDGCGLLRIEHLRGGQVFLAPLGTLIKRHRFATSLGSPASSPPQAPSDSAGLTRATSLRTMSYISRLTSRQIAPA
jgi:hypothetical protein